MLVPSTSIRSESSAFVAPGAPAARARARGATAMWWWHARRISSRETYLSASRPKKATFEPWFPGVLLQLTLDILIPRTGCGTAADLCLATVHTSREGSRIRDSKLWEEQTVEGHCQIKQTLPRMLKSHIGKGFFPPRDRGNAADDSACSILQQSGHRS